MQTTRAKGAKALGRWLRARREALHMSLEDVARRAGTTASQVSRLELGSIGKPAMEDLLRLATALELTDEQWLRVVRLLLPAAVEPPILMGDERWCLVRQFVEGLAADKQRPVVDFLFDWFLGARGGGL